MTAPQQTPTQQLHEAGQSLWLDNITRGLLDRGTLAGYITDNSITGLTSNPTIFDKAIEAGADYDADIATHKAAGGSDEDVFFELALSDLRRAADLFAPAHQRTDGVDGWVSLEVSPLLVHDTAATTAQAKKLHAKAERPNVFIKIPGTPEGNLAIEECTFAGLPINVTLLFSAAQYQASADAYLRGIERRVAAGLNPAVTSVGSVFVSRWDTAVADRVPAELRDRLGIAVARQAYRAYRELLDSPRWGRLANAAVQHGVVLGHLLAEYPQQRQLGHLQHRHLAVGGAGGGRGLQTDPACPDDRHPLRGGESGLHRFAVRQPTQVQHPQQVVAGHGEASGSRTGGQRQFVVANRLTALDGHLVGSPVDGGDSGVQPQVHVVLGVPPLRVDVDLLQLGFALQVVLGQRGPVVGAFVFFPEEDDPAVERLLAERFGGLGASQARPDDDKTLLCGHGVCHTPLVVDRCIGPCLVSMCWCAAPARRQLLAEVIPARGKLRHPVVVVVVDADRREPVEYGLASVSVPRMLSSRIWLWSATAARAVRRRPGWRSRPAVHRSRCRGGTRKTTRPRRCASGRARSRGRGACQ